MSDFGVIYKNGVEYAGGGGEVSPATADTLGIVKPDNVTTFVDEMGILSAQGTQFGKMTEEDFLKLPEEEQLNYVGLIEYESDNDKVLDSDDIGYGSGSVKDKLDEVDRNIDKLTKPRMITTVAEMDALRGNCLVEMSASVATEFGIFGSYYIVASYGANENDNYGHQIAYERAGNGYIYSRINANGVWQGWQRLVTEEEIANYYYAPLVREVTVSGANTVTFDCKVKELYEITYNHNWYGVGMYYASTNEETSVRANFMCGFDALEITGTRSGNTVTISIRNKISSNIGVRIRKIQ